MPRTPHRDFDPKAVKVLVAAYNEALDAIGLPHHPVGRSPKTPQDTVALSIIDLALTGETDPKRLLDAGTRSARSEARWLGREFAEEVSASSDAGTASARSPSEEWRDAFTLVTQAARAAAPDAARR